MMEFIKGAFKGFEHGIFEWDQPTKRVRSDGTVVYGRPTRGFGDGGTFSYAGKDYSPEPWIPTVELIRDHAQAVMAMKYGIVEYDRALSFCLAGLYPHGTDGIPFHSDTVPTLDDIVVSISLGAPRVFTNRVYDENIKDESNTSNVDKKMIAYMEEHGAFKDTHYLMEDGDVIIFDGHSQLNSMHMVPPVEGVGERVNLTFRSGL